MIRCMYKINPDYPLVWRTPTSLQIGVDNPHVVLAKIYPSEERFITALQSGFGDVSLPTVSEECGMTSAETDGLLLALNSALLPQSGPGLSANRYRISLDGTGPFVDSVGLLLIGIGHTVVKTSAAVSPRCDLAIVVGEYVIEPSRIGGWLRKNVPHLPVVFSDQNVRIGPFLGATPESQANLLDFPCSQCIELHHRDRDDCWPAMASQLAGKPAPSNTALLRAEVSALIARWISSRESVSIAPNTSLNIAVKTGEIQEITFELHPDCACQALPRNVSVLGSMHGQFPVAPTREKVASLLV
jgi:hypothetical protein